ncbi:IS66 family transposase [bacterium]|nr:IS66 family transposase [bacterium]
MSISSPETIQISREEFEHFVSLETKVSELNLAIEKQNDKIVQQGDWIKILQKQLYGPKSEKTKKPDTITEVEYNQLTIFEVMEGVEFEEIENTPSSESGTDEIQSTDENESDKQKKKSSGRRIVARNLPVQEIVLEVPEEYRVDENGEPLVVIGYEYSERLHRIPEQYVRQVIKREILGYKDSRERYVVAAPKNAIIPKGKLTDEFILHIVFEKYFNGMPLYRQQKSLNALGIDVSRSTMADAVKKCSDLFVPVVEATKKQIFDSKYVHADESPLKHKTKDKEYKNGYMFVYQNAQQAYFTFSKNKTQKVIANLLETGDSGRYLGYLMCDGYAGYNIHQGKRLACWAHARRKFFEASEDNAKAKCILKIIGKLYKVEKQVAIEKEKQGWSEEEFFRQRFERRNLESRKHIGELEKRLLEYENKFKSPMRKAIRYALKNWAELQVYLEDGCLPIDNNAAERSIRSMVIGRKNYLFVGSKDGGDRAANCYTIMESCRLQGLDPRDYMLAITPVLIENRDNPDYDYSQLTPKNVCDQVRLIRKMKKNL